ncbi:Ig-like domain-containing protein [Hydrogenophaga electricum]|uniref:Fibronectin type-III domain-containing protein n=1 Tax=Hydrogenophaga electricum TaxID=1230953 RepID=A0ABQ6CAF4_9BURK|nr:Ig-like domain-containing protein [Hydrogenophaga electricum]GLS16920.1 hypothetical protein GCM10007935_43670 [Hydrogenophaga electricum]
MTALLLSLAVAGCGGVDDDAPTATLVTTPTSAAAGATVTLIAAAISDNGISGIQFYRVDSGTSTLLGTLNATPYQFTTTVPASATGSVSYFATAVDAYGNTGDSDYAVVTITN